MNIVEILLNHWREKLDFKAHTWKCFSGSSGCYFCNVTVKSICLFRQFRYIHRYMWE